MNYSLCDPLLLLKPEWGDLVGQDDRRQNCRKGKRQDCCWWWSSWSQSLKELLQRCSARRLLVVSEAAGVDWSGELVPVGEGVVSLIEFCAERLSLVVEGQHCRSLASPFFLQYLRTSRCMT
jgi:hypothetical protein